MRRRSLIGAAGLCATWRSVNAQRARKLHRIGVVVSQFKVADITGPQTQSPAVNALLAGLRELGYVYGESFVTVPKSSEGKPERFHALAAELVAAQVDVIVALGPALPALKQATATIPIVMTGSGDPVGQGFVQSLARPGGNITGLSLQSLDTVGKRLGCRARSSAPRARLPCCGSLQPAAVAGSPGCGPGPAGGRCCRWRCAMRSSWRRPSRKRTRLAPAGCWC